MKTTLFHWLRMDFCRGVKSSEILLYQLETTRKTSFCWHWFTLLVVQAYKLSWKLFMQTHTNCTISFLECHFPIPSRSAL